MSSYLSLILLVALIFTSSFFSISEISLAAAKKIRLRTLAEEGHKKASRVIALQEHPGHFFTVIQISVNALSLAGGILGERFFSPAFANFALFLGAKPTVAETFGFWAAFIVSTVAFILFADLIPKRLALVAPEKIAMTIIGPMSVLIRLLKPFIWFFNGLANIIIRSLGLPEHAKDKITSEDILATVNAGTAAGVIATEEQIAIENIFELESRTVPSSMTPRENIVYFLLDEKEEDICRKVIDLPHNQYLVCNGSLDNVVGVTGGSEEAVLHQNLLVCRGQNIVTLYQFQHELSHPVLGGGLHWHGDPFLFQVFPHYQQRPVNRMLVVHHVRESDVRSEREPLHTQGNHPLHQGDGLIQRFHPVIQVRQQMGMPVMFPLENVLPLFMEPIHAYNYLSCFFLYCP